MTNAQKKSLFSLGQIVATPGAIDALTQHGMLALPLLQRHVTGDWGDLCKEDIASNNDAVEHGDRILSSYVIAANVKLWVITEWDRSVTTILLPSEY